MDVVIAGGHGKVALRLGQLLSRDGHRARALIRNPDHVADVEKVGAEPVLLDLEHADVEALARAAAGADAAVFAAGAGPGSGPARKRTVDYGGARKLIDACTQVGIDRYVMVSSIGAHAPEQGSQAMGPYLRAKADADADLVASGLAWTIVRPGSLTDEPGTGRVRVTTDLGHRGPVPRDDVAAVLYETLVTGGPLRVTFELFAGDTPIPEAIASLAHSS